MNPVDYEKWLNNTNAGVKDMTIDEIKHRILELKEMTFLANREWSLLQTEFDKRKEKKSNPDEA